MYKLVWIMILLIFTSCSNDGVMIKIKNNSGKSISDISIYYTGGVKKIDILSNMQVWKGTLNPRGESSLKIELFDDKNKKYFSIIDVYLENGYSGYIDIEIDSTYRMSYENHIKSTFL
jgi:hypothetical protein